MSLSRTPYFPMSVKPVREGWYEVSIPWSLGFDVHRFYWTGRAWRKWDGVWFRKFPEEAKWRGLNFKPRGARDD
jgi:hypothetical protein